MYYIYAETYEGDTLKYCNGEFTHQPKDEQVFDDLELATEAAQAEVNQFPSIKSFRIDRYTGGEYPNDWETVKEWLREPAHA